MSEVKVDTISERTAAGGVTIDGVLIKDSIVNTDNIAEKTAAAGVTIDGVLVKDGVATFQTAAGSPLVFEGATADAFETTFAITDPTADRTITFPDSSFTVPTAGGLTAASLWRMTSTFAGNADPIASNLAAATDVGQGVLGSSMTESSGIFTFPSTGYWHVTATFTFNRFAGDDAATGVIKYTANDGGAWSNAASIYYYLDTAAQDYGTVSGNCLFDITDTANQKVSFKVSQDNTGNKTSGSATQNYTYFTFVKLADT